MKPLEAGQSLLHWYALRIYTGMKPKAFIKVDLAETLIHCHSNIWVVAELGNIIYVIKMIALFCGFCTRIAGKRRKLVFN